MTEEERKEAQRKYVRKYYQKNKDKIMKEYYAKKRRNLQNDKSN
jgi:hypothetical protein